MFLRFLTTLALPCGRAPEEQDKLAFEVNKCG
jgi:hypothetical protein